MSEFDDEGRGPQEVAYDELINPLIAQIIDICREHAIPFFATARFERGACTTALPIGVGDGESGEAANAVVAHLVNVVRSGYIAVPPFSTSMIVESNERGDRA